MADNKDKEEKQDNDEKESKKKYSWSDKSRQERVQHKMLFLVFLAVLFLFTAFIYFKSDARNSSDESNRYESIENENDDVDYSEKSDEIADKYKNNTNEDKNNDDDENKESSDADEPEVISQDANEYEEEYSKKYSQDLIDGLKKNSKIVMDMYFDKDTKNKTWKKIATDDFRKNIKDNLSDDKQKVISYEIFATKKYNDDEIIIGVVAELEDDVYYYNLIYKEKDNQVRLNDIVFMW